MTNIDKILRQPEFRELMVMWRSEEYICVRHRVNGKMKVIKL